MQPRLPLYGPLQIEDIRDFLSKSKKRFFKAYNKTFPSVVKIDQFEILYTLGKGTFGTVKLVRDKTCKKYFAVKALEKCKLVEIGEISHALNEKRVLQSIDFPFGVRMEHFSQDNAYIYFLMPFISGGDMFTHLRKFGKFKERLSCFYAAQIVLVLEYFQYLCFVYRDLKPENILIDHRGFVKITDFGFAKLVESRTYTFCGTPPYVAPEVIQGVGYGRSADWWSLGVLIYEMNAGHLPFYARDNVTLFTKIMYDTFSVPTHFSVELLNILRKLLQRDVTRRLGNLKNGADDVKNHNWFRNTDWLRLLNRQIVPPFIPEHTGHGDVYNFPDVRNSSGLNIYENDEFDYVFKDF